MAQASMDTEFAEARAELYDLLSRVFDGDVTVLMEAMETGAFTDFVRVLPADIDTAAVSRDDLDSEALAIGYDNLFEVPGPYYVPPFASGHATDPSESFDSDAKYHEVGTAGELLGEPAESVAELYERTNFSPERGAGIPDHVAAEFEFMASLAAQQAQLGHDDLAQPGPGDQAPHSSDDQAQHGFGKEVTLEALLSVQEQMLDHLEWFDVFADEVAKKDTAEGVYAAVCSIANAFIAWDQQQLAGPTGRN